MGIYLKKWIILFAIFIFKIQLYIHYAMNSHTRYQNTWSDNKVRELATVCLLWQQWTKALV